MNKNKKNLIFFFDEEMEQIEGQKTFTDWSDNDSDYEIDDQDLNKILIVTQAHSLALRKHPGGDRTGYPCLKQKLHLNLLKLSAMVYIIMSRICGWKNMKTNTQP